MSANESLPGLTPKQQKAIECLLAEPTTKDAAKAAGISEATIHRWLREEPFKAAYEAALKTSFETAIKSLQSLTSEAMKALRAILTDTTVTPAVRISAVRTTLEFAIKVRDQEEVLTRLQYVEEQIARSKK